VTDEQVLVVPAKAVREEFGGASGWSGVRPAGEAAIADVIRRVGTFRRRVEMEDDPAWKQVIPYPILRQEAAWFLMRRTRAGSDTRLHDRFTIGVGGHVNPEDGGLDGDMAPALRREWHEELRVDFVPEFRFVGVLNDDSSAVGRVHLGLVYLADAGGRPVAVRETDKLAGGFVATAQVAAVRDRLETWSRIAFEWLVDDPALR